MVYLDHNATSPPRPEVLEQALPYVHQHWGNPSSTHSAAREPARALDTARARVAAYVGARPRDVVFTASATEANHLALHGRRALVSAVEHVSVFGAAGTWPRIPVRPSGRVSAADLAELLDPSIDIVSVQAANNETGVLQDLAGLAEVVHAAGRLLHVDAVQVVGRLAPSELEVADLVTLSAHKAGGLKGAGALVVRRGGVQPLLSGGSQERGRRAGTVDVAPCVALGVVVGLPLPRFPELGGLARTVVALGGRVTAGGLPNTLHACFDVPGDAIVMGLDLLGVCVSQGSACSSGASEPSHVLAAMGLDPRSGLRVSTGWNTTTADLDALADALHQVVPRTREALG